MRDDPLSVLEAELVGAARRMAAGVGRPPVGVRRLRSSLGAVAAALAAAVALVVGAGAVVLLGHHGGSAGSGEPAQTTTEVGQPAPLLLERRVRALIGDDEASPAEMRLAQSVSQQAGFGGYSSFSSTTGAVTAPGGVRIELWELAARPTGKPPTNVLAAVVRGRVVGRVTAAQALTRGLVFVYGYTPSGTRVAVVVPNEVSRVRLRVPGGRSMLAAVHDNIAAFEVTGFRLVRITAGARIIWYEGNGRVPRLARRVPPLH